MLFFLLIIFSVYLYSIFPIAFIAIFTQGEVTIDMESIHYKNESQIPIYITATGPVSFISIKLLKENSDHNLTLNDSIELNLNHNSNKITYGNNSILFGNSLNNGKFNVFVNTTNLTEGYYELVCVKSDKYVKGFYLLG